MIEPPGRKVLECTASASMIVKTPTCSQSPGHKHTIQMGWFVDEYHQGSSCICKDSQQKAGIALQIKYKLS